MPMANPPGGMGGGGRFWGGRGGGGTSMAAAGCAMGMGAADMPPGPPFLSWVFLKANCRKNSLVSLFHSDQKRPSDLSTSRLGT